VDLKMATKLIGRLRGSDATSGLSSLQEENLQLRERIFELEQREQHLMAVVDELRTKENASQKAVDAFPALLLEASARVLWQDVMPRIPHRDLWNDALDTNLARLLSTQQEEQQPQQPQQPQPPQQPQQPQQPLPIKVVNVPRVIPPPPPAFAGKVVLVKNCRGQYGTCVAEVVSSFLQKSFPKESWKVELDDDSSCIDDLKNDGKKAFLGFVVEQIHGARLIDTRETQDHVESLKMNCDNVVLCLIKETDRSGTVSPSPKYDDYDFSEINGKRYNLYLQGIEHISPDTTHNKNVLHRFEKEIKDLLLSKH